MLLPFRLCHGRGAIVTAVRQDTIRANSVTECLTAARAAYRRTAVLVDEFYRTTDPESRGPEELRVLEELSQRNAAALNEYNHALAAYAHLILQARR